DLVLLWKEKRYMISIMKKSNAKSGSHFEDEQGMCWLSVVSKFLTITSYLSYHRYEGQRTLWLIQRRSSQNPNERMFSLATMMTTNHPQNNRRQITRALKQQSSISPHTKRTHVKHSKRWDLISGAQQINLSLISLLGTFKPSHTR